MKINRLSVCAATALLAMAACNTKHESESALDSLRHGFEAPPPEARPRALWDWVDGNFDKEEISRELEEAQRMGMGGFDIWDVRKVVDNNNVVPAGPAFMGEESLDAICHALSEGKRLGLAMGLIISSGWNAGGIWTKPQHQTMGVFRREMIVQGPRKFSEKLQFPDLPAQAGKKGQERPVFIPLDESGLPVFYKEIAVLAIPLNDDSVINTAQIIDLSTQMSADGKLEWDVPTGKWKLVRYVCTNTGQSMIACTPNSAGPMIDHFNPEASVEHIEYFIRKIEQKTGVPVAKSGLDYLYTDSYEVVGQLWTPALADEFQKRCGYSLLPYLPALEGYIIDDENITGRFMYDFRKVLSDLIIEGHYAKSKAVCESHGIGFVAEAAGPGWPVHNCPFESLKSSGVLTYPRGEFWHMPTKNEAWRRMINERGSHYLFDLQVIKGVSSASHIYDQTYVEAEAFTGTHLWVEGPGDLKPTADRAFCEGLNRIVFHTWPHTPKAAGVPGWVYAFGTLMNETRIWWPLAKPWLTYLGRCSYLLQQGRFVGDALYYYGDSAPNFVPPKKYDPALGNGFDYDYTNTDILMNRLSVKNGKLVLPHGQSYEFLVLPDVQYILPEILEKIEQLVREGATVIGPRPVRSHGLKDWQQRDRRVIELASQLWGDCDGVNVLENQYGKGKIVWGKTPAQVLKEKDIAADFDFTGVAPATDLDYIHRRIGQIDVYFVRNRTDKLIHGDALFRASDKKPEIWNPVTGRMTACPVFVNEGIRTRVPLALEGYESLFVILTPDDRQSHIERIEKDGQTLFPFRTSDNGNLLHFEVNTEAGLHPLALLNPGLYTFTRTGGKRDELLIEDCKKTIAIAGPWQVMFPEDKSGPGQVVFDSLFWWKDSPDEGIKYFSGIAVYEKEIDIPASMLGDSTDLFLTLEQLREVARVSLNGQEAAISWMPPHRIQLSRLAKPGKNTLRIEVANTWSNRLCGDAKLPPEKRITHTNVTHLPNAWWQPMESIPNKSYDLLEGGIKGEVTLTIRRLW